MQTKSIKAGLGSELVEITTEVSQTFEGTIVITDPCYFIPEDIWIDLCDKAWFDNKKSTSFTNAGTIYYNGTKILYTSTAHGDGSFIVEPTEGITQEKFGVDAGMMAIISLEDYKKISKEELTPGLYAIVENFCGEIDADGNGNFVGALEVWTDGSNEVEVEEDEWERDEDDYREDDDNTDW